MRGRMTVIVTVVLVMLAGGSAWATLAEQEGPSDVISPPVLIPSGRVGSPVSTQVQPPSGPGRGTPSPTATPTPAVTSVATPTGPAGPAKRHAPSTGSARPSDRSDPVSTPDSSYLPTPETVRRHVDPVEDHEDDHSPSEREESQQHDDDE
jgi:hypothetical protein